MMGAMEMPTRIKKDTWNQYSAIPASRPARPERANIGKSPIAFILQQSMCDPGQLVRLQSWRLPV